MAHYYFERMMGHEYPDISGYHKVTVDEMNGTTDQDKEQKIKKIMAKDKVNGIVLFGDLSKKPNIVESDQSNDAKSKMSCIQLRHCKKYILGLRFKS